MVAGLINTSLQRDQPHTDMVQGCRRDENAVKTSSFSRPVQHDKAPGKDSLPAPSHSRPAPTKSHDATKSLERQQISSDPVRATSQSLLQGKPVGSIVPDLLCSPGAEAAMADPSNGGRAASRSGITPGQAHLPSIAKPAPHASQAVHRHGQPNSPRGWEPNSSQAVPALSTAAPEAGVQFPASAFYSPDRLHSTSAVSVSDSTCSGVSGPSDFVDDAGEYVDGDVYVASYDHGDMASIFPAFPAEFRLSSHSELAAYASESSLTQPKKHRQGTAAVSHGGPYTASRR